MNLNNYFEKYEDIIFGIRKSGEDRIIDVVFSKKWVIDSDKFGENIIFKDMKEMGDNDMYYIIYSKVLSFDDLFDRVVNIIEFNIDTEKKMKLYDKSVGRLKDLFTNKSFDELKSLTFHTNGLIGHSNDESENKENVV